MVKIFENKKYYYSKKQRAVLLKLLNNNDISKNFFLTGETALSVFYLYHRKSKDLDFFTLKKFDLEKIDFWIKRKWKKKPLKLRGSELFLSYIIENIKVDFVIDFLSIKGKREKYIFENGRILIVDRIDNIYSNKFNTIVSRSEIKDFLDFYYISKKFKNLNLYHIYNLSKKKMQFLMTLRQLHINWKHL